MPIRMYDNRAEKDRMVYGFVWIENKSYAVTYEKDDQDNYSMVEVPANQLRPIE